jgi:radical SAM superfamily enzyme YgiQ (UPF0313 family)
MVMMNPAFWRSEKNVIGEAKNVICPLLREVEEGTPIPRQIKGTPVNAKDVPTTIGPAICGLVEVSRGCGR